MEPHIEQFELDGRPIAACFPAYDGPAAPVVYMLSGPDPALELSAALKIAGGPTAFSTVAVGSSIWNIDYSPWPAPPVLARDSPFEGGAVNMLDWLTGAVIPWAEEKVPENRAKYRGIMGYSLAGLSALYAMYVTDAFDACASCSGSLWFDGWRAFIGQNRVHPESRIYLSLGRGEEKTRNRRMAAVGDVTREAASIYQADPGVSETVLVWHDGRHFSKIPERTADAMNWLARC